MELATALEKSLESNPNVVLASAQRFTLRDRLKKIRKTHGDPMLVAEVCRDYFAERWNFNIAPANELCSIEELNPFMDSLFSPAFEALIRNLFPQFSKMERMNFYNLYRNMSCGYFSFEETFGKIKVEPKAISTDPADLAEIVDSIGAFGFEHDLKRGITVCIYPNTAMALHCPMGFVGSADGYLNFRGSNTIHVRPIPPQTIITYQGSTIGFSYNEAETKLEDKLAVTIQFKDGKTSQILPLSSVRSSDFSRLAGIDQQDTKKPIGYLKDKLSAWVARASHS
ncbi:MAG: hypothetical protein AABX00_02430 [Nanoarchaeota archaeon]